MVDRVIDYDRGVVIRTVADIGMDVYMYRDSPGVYLTAAGHHVPPELADRAGFDIARLEKLRVRKERLGQAQTAIEKELAISEASSNRQVVAAKGGFKVYVLGGGRHVVEDPDGNVLTTGHALTKEVAMAVFNAFTKDVPADKPQLPPALRAGDGGGNGPAAAGAKR